MFLAAAVAARVFERKDKEVIGLTMDVAAERAARGLAEGGGALRLFFAAGEAPEPFFGEKDLRLLGGA